MTPVDQAIAAADDVVDAEVWGEPLFDPAWFVDTATGRPPGSPRKLRDRGRVSRFVSAPSHGQRQRAGLRADHPAVLEGRTLFRKSVVPADRSPRILVSGVNSSKIGRCVEKGPWRGLPVFTVTLEERATCPSSCHLWRECFGNAMPWARRHSPGPALEAALASELAAHSGPLAVRLHVLGDFYAEDYVRFWFRQMAELPGLHVFGFTAHEVTSPIGALIAAANTAWRGRFSIRFSVPPGAPSAPMQATTVWRRPTIPRVEEGLMCPAQTGRTEACVTCGLCWSLSAEAERIVFVGHGKTGTGRPRHAR